jgi:hypothetical protein
MEMREVNKYGRGVREDTGVPVEFSTIGRLIMVELLFLSTRTGI